MLVSTVPGNYGNGKLWAQTGKRQRRSSIKERRAKRLTTGCGGRWWIKCQGTRFSAPPLNRDVRFQKWAGRKITGDELRDSRRTSGRRTRTLRIIGRRLKPATLAVASIVARRLAVEYTRLGRPECARNWSNCTVFSLWNR